MRVLHVVLLAVCLWPQVSSADEDARASTTEELLGRETPESSAPETGWHALPRGRAFPMVLSDPREVGLGVRRSQRGEIEADVGGFRSLVGWSGTVGGQSTHVHFGIEGAAYFLMEREGSTFPLHSSDGLFGLYAEAVRGRWQYQLRFTHLSAHLSDGLYGVRERISYTREFLTLRAARRVGPFRPYAGYQVLVHTNPPLPRHSLQVGTYGVLPWRVGIAHPYVGGDVRMRSAEEGHTLHLATGAVLVPRQGGSSVRVVLSYLKGRDLRGQFYMERTRRVALGLMLDL